MRTIIAGSRTCLQMSHLINAVAHCGWKPTVVLCGGAKGADKLGETWAKCAGVPIESYPAHWELHGRAAGRVRNVEMGAKADALIALWNGKSTGTKHMIETAERMGLTTFVYRTDLELP
jgi:hypothetical protein